jgi:hypothetical protein
LTFAGGQCGSRLKSAMVLPSADICAISRA